MSKNNFFLFLLAIIPSAYATTGCFQEFANQSTVCGGLDGGWYTFFGSYSGGSPMSNFYDGDYDTTWKCDSCSEGSDYWEIVYEKPVGATNNSLWQVKEWDYQNLVNFSISNECWNYNSTYLLLSAFSSGYSEHTTYSCFNGSSYKTIAGAGSGDQYIFEEGMYWFIEEIPAPSPSPEQESIFYTSLASSGTGLGIFLDAIKMPLANVLLGLGIVVSVILIIYIFIFHLRTLIKPKPLR